MVSEHKKKDKLIKVCFIWKIMAQDDLKGFFENFLTKEPLFREKKALQASYIPETIIHRDEEIKRIANILAPSLKLEKPSNLFIYGKTGTGKTLSIRYTIKNMLSVAKEKGIPLNIIYVNCKLKKVADTEYRLISQLIHELGKQVPSTGLPTDEVYKIFFNLIDQKEQILMLVLDEIDQLIKKAGDAVLYNLTRINSELKNCQLSLVGISNDMLFSDHIDPRVKSSLSEENVVFPPYNAIQLQNILKRRAKVAFKLNTMSEGVIEKCAAYAAREHGDARRALELLRVAGEIAERENNKKILLAHIDHAQDKLEKDLMEEVIITQPKQFQAVIYSILSANINKKEGIFTGEVYEVYKGVCLQTGLRPLTQRRVSDVIGELDMIGIINARVISKGRYGRTRQISIAVPDLLRPKLKKIIQGALNI